MFHLPRMLSDNSRAGSKAAEQVAAKRCIYAVGLLLITVALGGCERPADPRAHPWTATAYSSFPDPVDFVDLNGDGADEALYIERGALRVGHLGVAITTLDGKIIEQINISGRYRPAAVGGGFQTAIMEDLTGDSQLEIIFPLVRSDSLFLYVYTARGRFFSRVFLAAGEPRQTPSGSLEWDPRVHSVTAEDVTGDGRRELVTVVWTGYARYPRGVFVNSLPDGEPIGSWTSGMCIREVTDGLGTDRKSLLLAASACSNGADEGGFSDENAYVALVDLAASPEIRWVHARSGRFTTSTALVLPGSPTRIVAHFGSHRHRPVNEPLRILDADSGSMITERVMPAEIDGFTVLRHPRGRSYIVALTLDQTVRVFDDELTPIRARSFHKTCALNDPLDVTGDGKAEIPLVCASGVIFLDERLRTRLVLPGAPTGRVQFASVSRGRGSVPLLALHARGSEGPTMLYEVNRHAAWPVYRYGQVAGILALLAFLGAAGAGTWRANRRRRREAVICDALLEGDRQGVLILDPDGRVLRPAPAAYRQLGLTDVDAHAEIDRLLQISADLEEVIAQLAEPNAPAIERWISLRIDDREVRVRIAARRIDLGGDSDYAVVMWLISPDVEAGTAWPALARRVIHDIKNPLTSILLTLQRMQMEAHASSSEIGPRLDPYIAKIEDRIGRLRRVTTTMLKFLDAEAGTRVALDLNEFVHTTVEGIRRTIPPDIRLLVRPVDARLPVQADPDQIASAIENLVSNAIQAMEDGGVLTVQLRRSKGLQPHPGHSGGDWAVVEVLDTGSGMDDSVRRRALEPGFSTRPDGTGLGLVIVRKIVDDHGGFLTIETEPDTGTAVSLFLPLSRSTGESDSEGTPTRIEFPA